MPVWAISWKVLKGLKLNLVPTQMLTRGNAEDRNHNPILHFTSFHKRWFSLSCLGVQVVFA